MFKSKPTKAIEPGGLLPDEHRDALLKGRRAATVAAITSSRNIMAILLVLSLLSNAVSGLGWQRAEQRYAENVRVEWVKLSPDGTYSVEFSDDSKPVQFFQSTVDSKLIEWVEKSNSRMRATISTDFGFASIFMSEPMKNDFMNNLDGIGAPKVAAKLIGCAECDETEYKVRNIQSIDQDEIPGRKNDAIPGRKTDSLYTTLAFVVERKITKDGEVTGCNNKIMTLLWKFRTKADTVARGSEQLRYNPLGMEIDRKSVRDDPTPVKAEECAKR